MTMVDGEEGREYCVCGEGLLLRKHLETSSCFGVRHLLEDSPFSPRPTLSRPLPLFGLGQGLGCVFVAKRGCGGAWAYPLANKARETYTWFCRESRRKQHEHTAMSVVVQLGCAW